MCATKICTFLICLVIFVLHKTNSFYMYMSNRPLYNISSDTFQGLDVREMEYLDLSSCFIGNMHTNSFQNMNKLIDLDLKFNHLQDLPDKLFLHTTNLKQLNLYGNKIKLLPNNILSNLTSLKTLQLGQNIIHALDPRTFENNVNLNSLGLSTNNIEELPQHIFDKLTYLETLKLFGNNISAIDNTTFYQNTQLLTLDLSRNKLTKIKSGTFIYLLKLKDLRLNNNEINYIETSAFPVSSALESLYLNNNELQFLHPGVIIILKDITLITLYDNPWKCNSRIKPLLTTLDKYGDNIPICAKPAALAGKRWDSLGDKNFPSAVLIISPNTTIHYAETDESVLFSCRVVGDEDVTTVQWTHEFNVLSTGNNNKFVIESKVFNGSSLKNLHINSVQKHDGGMYKCLYQDGAELIEHKIILSVHDVEKNRDLSWDKGAVAFTYDKNIYTNLKQSVQLACLLDSQFEANMYWAFNDKIISNTSDVRYHTKQSLATNSSMWFNMTIFYVRSEDVGTYTCESVYINSVNNTYNQPLLVKHVNAFHVFIVN